MNNSTPDLSVVIIARNEARNIARTIESVLKAVENRPQTEIFLVDSVSTDETVEIAKGYPINILRLKPSWFLSASGGRLIGMHYTCGELVLHVDGDMELDPECVNRLESYILEHPEVGAVGGYLRNVYLENGGIIGEEDQFRDPHGRLIDEETVGGVCLYRRIALEQIGGHHPFIIGEQDTYLCLALRHAGYKIIRLPLLMSRHYCISENTLPGNLRRFRRNLWIGFGQVPRYLWGTNLFWSYLKLNVRLLIYLSGIFLSLVAFLLTIFSKNLVYLGSWMLFIVLLIIIISIKKHSLRKTILSLLIHAMIAISAVRGFFMPPRSPAEYPTDAEIVQVAYNLGGVDDAIVSKNV